MGDVSTAHSGRAGGMTRQQRGVVLAAALGALFEWYDFAICVLLAATLGDAFFPAPGPSGAYLGALGIFAAGFAMRPLGALLFGWIGDRAGRAAALPLALTIAGLSSTAVGLLPGAATIGVAAPTLLVLLRLLQGLALGGGQGGAITYVAEYAPRGRRGAYASSVPAAATAGLLAAVAAVLACRGSFDAARFAAWAWRLPFLVAPLPLAAAAYIRWRLGEPPVFEQLAADEGRSPAALGPSLLEPHNLRNLLAALLGGTAGQAAVSYCGQLYPLYFLTRILKLDAPAAGELAVAALAVGVPGALVFGALSDRVGRKPLILLGCLLAVVTYFPMFRALTHYANPAFEAAIDKAPVSLAADRARCSPLFDLVAAARVPTACDVARRALVARGVPFEPVAAAPGSAVVIHIGRMTVPGYDAAAPGAKEKAAAFDKALTAALGAAGYPGEADPARVNRVAVAVLLAVLALYAALVTGPIAAMLAELFPTPLRYTSVSLPYEIGHAWFAGLLPAIAVAIVTYSGNIYYGLWYPVSVAAMTLLVGVLFVPETKDRALGVRPPE
jgi:MFS transporter/sugar transport protein